MRTTTFPVLFEKQSTVFEKISIVNEIMPHLIETTGDE